MYILINATEHSLKLKPVVMLPNADVHMWYLEGIGLTLTELSETFEQVGVSLLHTLDFQLFGCLVFPPHMWLTQEL